MKLISLNVGMPQVVTYNGKQVLTSIFKSPVTGERRVAGVNIEGDGQSDLAVHGGEQKAVYSYDLSHYNHWQQVLYRDDWSYGSFGENLSTEGLQDDQVLMGNVYKIGSVYLKAVQPRFPCFKLNIKFSKHDMIEQFTRQRRNGIYFSIVQEGFLKAGDSIELAEQSRHQVTIQQVVEAYYDKGSDPSLLEQILQIEFLPPRLRKAFEAF